MRWGEPFPIASSPGKVSALELASPDVEGVRAPSAPASGPDAPSGATAATSGSPPACSEAGRASSRSGGPGPYRIRSRGRLLGLHCRELALGTVTTVRWRVRSSVERRPNSSRKVRRRIAPITTPSRRPIRGYLCLSGGRARVAGLKVGDPFGRLMNESTETARVLRKSAKPFSARRSKHRMP